MFCSVLVPHSGSVVESQGTAADLQGERGGWAGPHVKCVFEPSSRHSCPKCCGLRRCRRTSSRSPSIMCHNLREVPTKRCGCLDRARAWSVWCCLDYVWGPGCLRPPGALKTHNVIDNHKPGLHSFRRGTHCLLVSWESGRKTSGGLDRAFCAIGFRQLTRLRQCASCTHDATDPTGCPAT